MLIWTDFTTQMNEVIEQIMPYGTFAWGNEFNKYRTFIRNISFETVNTAGDDRLVRATIPLTVNGTLALNDVSLATLGVSENLTVQGVTTLSGDVTVTNGLTVGGTLALHDVSLATIDVSNKLTVAGISTLTGAANVGMDSFVTQENKSVASAIVGGVNIFAGIVSTLQNFLPK